MNNAARHVLGLVVGAVATPAVLLLWAYGSAEVMRTFQVRMEISALGLSLMVVGGLIIGLLCGSRVSPLASLLPGLVFSAFGIAMLIDPYVIQGHIIDLLPRELEMGFLTLSGMGLLLGLGVALLTASVPPSRWTVLRKPPTVPYPQLPFATGGPGQPGQPGQPNLPGQPGVPGQAGAPGRPASDVPVAGPTPLVPPPGDAPQPPPLPYQPGT